MALNQAQKHVAALYAGGEYEYIETMLEAKDVADSLFLFCLNEAEDIDGTDGQDLSRLVERMDTAENELAQLRRALEQLLLEGVE